MHKIIFIYLYTFYENVFTNTPNTRCFSIVHYHKMLEIKKNVPLFSLGPRLSTWHCSHLMLSVGACYCMALNSLQYADVPLRNCSLTPATDRYLLPVLRSAANPPHAATAVDRWDRRTHMLPWHRCCEQRQTFSCHCTVVCCSQGTGARARSASCCDPRDEIDADLLEMVTLKGKKGKRSIAVRKKPHRYGNSRAIWDHTVLPATRQRWHSRLYPSRSWCVLD